MAEAAEDKTTTPDRVEYPNENMMFAGADPIEDEDLSTYDPASGEIVDEAKDEDTLETDVEAETKDEAEEETAEEEVETDEETEAEAESEAEETAEENAEEETKGEVETEETPEGADTDKTDPKEASKGIQIPKWRLDQETAKRRAAEQALADAQARQPTATETVDIPNIQVDVSELEKEYADMLLDGKTDRAAEIRGQINQKIQDATMQAALSTVDQKVDARVNESTSQTALDSVIDGLEGKHEFLREGSDTFDDALVGEIGAMFTGYVQKGFTPAEAMTKASDNALKLYKPELFEPAETAENTAPNLRTVTDPAKTREKEVKRNVEAAEQQPPELPVSEVSSDPTFNVDTMSDEELDALPESTKRRLRGDFL